MNYGLGMRLIPSVTGPQILVGAWSSRHGPLIVCICVIAIAVPVVWVLRRKARKAEEDLRALGIDFSALMTVNDATGKRPGQFGIAALLVLMTLAAIAFAIVRLPIPIYGKMFSLTALWIGFLIWQMCNFKFPPTATDRFNMAVTGLAGQALVIALYLYVCFVFGFGRRPLSYADFILFGVLAIGPALGIRKAIKEIRQAVSCGRSPSAVGPEIKR